MGKQDISLGRDVPIAQDSRVKLSGADVRFVQPYRERLEVYMNPEGILPVFVLFDNGVGADTIFSRVLTPDDTKAVNKAQRIIEKYIAHLLTDPDNTVPIVDKVP